MKKKLTAILCVDDEDIITNSLKSLLSINIKNVDVIEIAHSAEEALEVINEFEEDEIELQAIIVDYIMPEVRGDELLVQIHQKYPEVKKIMLTGQSDIGGVKRAINEAELYRFLEKPWNNDDLILTVNSAITSYRQTKEILEQNITLKKLNESLEQKVQERTEELEKLAITDKLTGIYNRVKLDNVLINEQNRSDRYHTNFGVIMIDIDYFKKVNDKFGHPIGDIVLRKFSKVLYQNLRKTDTLGRWGGEEFLIVCSETDLNGTLHLSEKLKEEIENYDFGIKRSITASFGVSMYKYNEKIKDVILRADKALYQAKDNGRNRIEYI